MTEELREDDFLYDLWNKGKVGHRAKILQIVMVKVGILKKGFYNSALPIRENMPEVEDLLMTAVNVGRNVSRHSNRRRNGIEFASFGGRFVQDFVDSFFSKTGMKHRSRTPLKGLPKGCDAQGWELRSDWILLILFWKNSEKRQVWKWKDAWELGASGSGWGPVSDVVQFFRGLSFCNLCSVKQWFSLRN